MRIALGAAWLTLAGINANFAASDAAVAASESAAASATVVIHADAQGAKVDRHIYGQFAEHLVNVDPNRMAPVPLSLAGRALHGVVRRFSFDAPDAVHAASFGGAAIEAAALTLTLPAKSIVFLSLR